MTESTQTKRSAGGWFLRPVLAVTAGALALTACDVDGLVNLTDPDIITLPTIEDTANIEAVRNGAVFEFARAYAGSAGSNSSGGQILQSGLLADELWYSSTFTTLKEIDARDVVPTNSALEDAFLFLHRARNLNEQVALLYEASPRANSPDHALVTSLAGYSYVFFAENYCSGVPISRASLGGDLEFGPPATTVQLLESSITFFDEAIAIANAAANQEQLSLARVGKARALLDLGRVTEAAQVAQGVPTGFEYLITYNANAVENGVWSNINSARRYSAASNEGLNGLRYFDRGAVTNTIDPRVPADSIGFGSGATAPLYAQLIYPDRGSDIPLATGVEARLIEAEAALNGGNSAAYLPILNQLRAPLGLAALTDPGTADARVLQLYQERAYWMWMTGHRLGDLRRLIRLYGFTEDEVFPQGTTIAGEAYGNDVNLPIPFVERNNPQFTGQCLNRDA